jgi:hypothetical protein
MSGEALTDGMLSFFTNIKAESKDKTRTTNASLLTIITQGFQNLVYSVSVFMTCGRTYTAFSWFFDCLFRRIT